MTWGPSFWRQGFNAFRREGAINAHMKDETLIRDNNGCRRGKTEPRPSLAHELARLVSSYLGRLFTIMCAFGETCREEIERQPTEVAYRGRSSRAVLAVIAQGETLREHTQVAERGG